MARHQAAELLKNYVASANSDVTHPVIQLASPEDLRAAFSNAGVPLPLTNGQEPVGVEALLGE